MNNEKEKITNKKNKNKKQTNQSKGKKMNNNNYSMKKKEDNKNINTEKKNKVQKKGIIESDDKKTMKKNEIDKVESELKNSNVENRINKEKLEEKTNDVKDVKIEEKTNKKGLIIVLIILLAVVAVCIYYQYNDNKNENSSEVSSEQSSEIMDNFYKYLNSKKTKIIYYASSTCGYCSLETPIMEQIAKDYNIDYLDIDSTKLTKSDQEKILKELNIEHATPTTIIVKNGKVLDTQIGYIDGGGMVEFLKNNKILDKDAVYTPEQYLTFIDYEEFKELLNKEGKHVVTIGQTGCSHCIKTKPVLNQIAKDYNIDINYLNITEMSQTENTSFVNTLEEIGYDEEEFVSSGNFGTPLTLIIENGKVTSYVSGERPTVQFIRALKKAGVISE